MPRHVWLLRTEDLLEGHTGLPSSRQDAEGPFQERRAGNAEQSGQRDTVAEKIASQATRAKKEAEKKSRKWYFRLQEETAGSGQAALLLSEITELLRAGYDDRHRRHRRSQMQQDQHQR